MTFGRGLRALSIASAVLITGAFALVFFYAPNDADQGFIQKIFYVHVPMAIVTLCGFVAGGDLRDPPPALGRPRRRPALLRRDPHLAVLAVGVLITGSIWARASWGHWWVWDEPTLVSFLIVFLLYACYQPLRFSIEDPERQARYASVFAIVAGAFVPLNFMAVRMAESLAHPRVLEHDGRRDAGRHAADVPRRARRDGVPVRDAVEVRARVQVRLDPAALAQAPARR